MPMLEKHLLHWDKLKVKRQENTIKINYAFTMRGI